MEPLLSAEHITICYNGIPAVQDVSFQVEPGEILGIVGESGSGKSTLIRGVMGLLGEGGRITGGDIWYKGENLKDMPEKKVPEVSGTGDRHGIPGLQGSFLPCPHSGSADL